jgi:hypothetical protein
LGQASGQKNYVTIVILAAPLLLKEEQELVDKVKSVAEKRRNLPPGGRLKEDYVFQWANDGKVGKSVKFSALLIGLHFLQNSRPTILLAPKL